VHDAVLMHVLNGWHYLEWKVFPSLLTNAEIASFEIIEHVLASHVIKDQILVVRVLEQVDELDDVRVITVLKNFDLLFEWVSTELTFVKFDLVIGLYGDKEASLFVLGTVNLPEGALADEDRCGEVLERGYILELL
jgi:hypothetical protein